ncbi:MAG: DUF4167 domain-containing protein [Novosphingobium sp.]|nr:DUF4167 domain-containing protein [Novosphingobium sp.]MCP5401628.1 DUF4167 domain-containing protein [Novosphingobium sp.]
MNSNRGSSRRRGRGNNRQQGGQPLNRIDSRARGNAPQLLEKYRKLAHDAHLNGERVTEEYYLQFADHYFRVIADQKQRQEEARQQRRDERSSDGNDSDREEGSSGADESTDRASSSGDASGRRERNEARRSDRDSDSSGDDGSDDDSQGNIYEPAENPFTRDGRSTRGVKPRRSRRDSRQSDDGEAEADEGSRSRDDEENNAAGLDPASLPPSISGEREATQEDGEEASAPKPRRRTTKRSKPPADDPGEPLQVAN